MRIFLQERISAITHELLPKILPSTKEYLAFQILEAVFEALDDNLPQLLLSIDLHRVVVEEIEAMHPKEVEALFYSFASIYFRELINYGFGFGVVFGLAMDVFFARNISIFLKIIIQNSLKNLIFEKSLKKV
ncbi:hypothetical protein [Raineya orbicola]|uniref:Uncharacterized protein n=1 Tax=Raineya orbicola TaxID=2016530 RepID=A0A2N3HY50_9BACT|nr:hypothetical protein [Raineya orbicola]PKQ62957.1 hypothetical protein Rain11_2668 [Raineya orbicola]